MYCFSLAVAPVGADLWDTNDCCTGQGRASHTGMPITVSVIEVMIGNRSLLCPSEHGADPLL